MLHVGSPRFSSVTDRNGVTGNVVPWKRQTPHPLVASGKGVLAGRVRSHWWPAVVIGLVLPATCGAAAIDGRVYPVGGCTGAVASAALEAFDPATGTWSRLSDVGVSRGLAAVALTGSLVVAGGATRQGIGPSDASETFVPAGDGGAGRIARHVDRPFRRPLRLRDGPRRAEAGRIVVPTHDGSRRTRPAPPLARRSR